MRKPDYVIKAKARDLSDERRSNRLGCAWSGTAGSISIALDPGVCLDWKFNEEFLITLFPFDSKE